MYAIIVTGGKQYKVSEGESIFVEKFDAVSGDSLHTGAEEGIKQEKHHKKRGFFKKED